MRIGDGYGILFQDAYLEFDSLSILLRKSKTDSVGKGHWIKLQRHVGSNVCVLDLLHEYLQLRLLIPLPLYCMRMGIL